MIQLKLSKISKNMK